MFTQMSEKQGIKKHGQATINALTQEFFQLDSKGVFEPVSASKLSDEDWKAALHTIMLLKEKWNGQLKGCAVANGCFQ